MALLNNVVNNSNTGFIKAVISDLEEIGVSNNFLIVSPDAGAYKKIFKLCTELKYAREIVLCNKIRDVSTGAIIKTTCDIENFNGEDLVIVDDICDGGGTFILLANELRKRNCGKIILVVSHGIFSKGLEALEGVDFIYSTDSFKNIEDTDKFRQISLYYLGM